MSAQLTTAALNITNQCIDQSLDLKSTDKDYNHMKEFSFAQILMFFLKIQILN